MAVITLPAFGASPLDYWHIRNPPPTGRPLNAVAFGSGLYVAVGEMGTVLKSSDANTWIEGNSGITNAFSGIGYGNGLFIALAGPKILTSANGDTWIERDSGITDTLSGVAFGNGVFVAVGGRVGPQNGPGVVLTSTDGSDWITRNSGITNGLYAVAFGNGLFVAVGDDNALFTSTDGAAWTLRDSGTAALAFRSTPDFYDVTFSNDRFVVVGAGWYGGPFVSPIMLSLTSTDGLNWTGQTPPVGTSTSFHRVTSTEGLFVALGSLGVWESTNGTSWLNTSSAYGDDITAGSDKFVIVGSGTGGSILTSENGVYWRDRTTNSVPASSYIDLAAGVYANGALLAAGGNPFFNPNDVPFLSSTDGFNWSTRGSTTTDRTTRIIHDQNIFLSLAGTAIMTSADGTNWITHGGITASTLLGVVFGNNQFVVVGSGGAVLTSTNGTSWKTRTSETILDLNGIAYGNNTFVAVGAAGTAVISADGIDWNNVGSGASETLFDVTFGNGIFVAAGQNGLILSSVDGSSWTNRVSGTTQTLHGVSFRDGLFVATGEAGTILTSSDSITWTSRSSGTIRDLFATFAANDTFIVVGNGGTILQSDPLTNTVPQILDQPQSQSVLAGATLSFEVNATGTSPISYEWWKDGVRIANATNSTLPIFGAQPSDAGSYTVLLSNPAGAAPPSQPATLAVDGRPVLKFGLGGPPLLLLYGPSGQSYQIDFETNVTSSNNWQALTTVFLTNSPGKYFDAQATNSLSRFYRALLLP